ncbi:hypothetical protein B296_00044422 [Ensete ventricosum]|uniref:Uncharacterized protein n=1 Tax=Ensete ventricosum TaxID=4639 RepID=A0A426ZB69_ENSVE|nr:hypothetical protein B296_00044422 [Ensete ventricosum]
MGNTNSAEGSSPRKCHLPSTRNYAHPSSYRYPQQPHFTAGSSFNNKDQTKQQPAFIADNFSSLEEVNYFVPLVVLTLYCLSMGQVLKLLCSLLLSHWLMQFVNFTKIMSENMPMAKKEAAFALSALMEIPLKYRATQGLKPKK